MLVDINLLPKKETKTYRMLIITIVAILFLLVIGILLFWHGKSLDRQLSTLDNQILTTQKLVEIEQKKTVGGMNTSNSVDMLEMAVVWASDDPVKTVPIIQHVTSLLPQRGFIQSISYTEAGNMDVTVQFDTSRESAYFLKNLLDSEWFSFVNLSSLSTTDVSITNSDNVTNQANQVVPRYIGQYQLQLNRTFIKNHENAFDKTEGRVDS